MYVNIICMYFYNLLLVVYIDIALLFASILTTFWLLHYSIIVSKSFVDLDFLKAKLTKTRLQLEIFV